MAARKRAAGARKLSKTEELRAALPRGWSFRTWSPGDGATRYRFFHKASKGQTYFGPASGAFTAVGLKEAVAFASGLRR